jgi:hypothetical protein
VTLAVEATEVAAENRKVIVSVVGVAQIKCVEAVWSGLDIVACTVLFADTPSTVIAVETLEAVALAIPPLIAVSKLMLVGVGVVITIEPLGLDRPTAPVLEFKVVTGALPLWVSTATPLT